MNLDFSVLNEYDKAQFLNLLLSKYVGRTGCVYRVLPLMIFNSVHPEDKCLGICRLVVKDYVDDYKKWREEHTLILSSTISQTVAVLSSVDRILFKIDFQHHPQLRYGLEYSVNSVCDQLLSLVLKLGLSNYDDLEDNLLECQFNKKELNALTHYRYLESFMKN